MTIDLGKLLNPNTYLSDRLSSKLVSILDAVELADCPTQFDECRLLELESTFLVMHNSLITAINQLLDEKIKQYEEDNKNEF